MTSIGVGRCSGGFYGDPQVVGGSCVRCQCNDNVDGEEAGHCHNVTGECLRCRNNTAGRHCEICAAGFYGDAVQQKNCTGERITADLFHVSLFCVSEVTEICCLAKGRHGSEVGAWFRSAAAAAAAPHFAFIGWTSPSSAAAQPRI